MPAITEGNSASVLTFTSFEIPSSATRLVVMLTVIGAEIGFALEAGA